MTRRAGKVAVACAIGAWIGTFVALEASPMFWWIGLIVGGLVGYLSYEGHEVAKAVPAAYRAARGWQPPPLYWKSVGLSALLWGGIALYGVLPLLAMLAFSPQALLTPTGSVEVLVSLLGIIMGALVGFWLFVYLLLQRMYFGARELKWRAEINRDLLTYIYCSTPPLLLFWHLPRGTGRVLQRIPAATRIAAIGTVAFLRFLCRFGWELFLRVHSEVRLLCGVDALLGTAVGYFAGSALVGAIVGGLIGLVNYTLVTEMWLRPRGYLPARS